jgi:DNA processing protein
MPSNDDQQLDPVSLAHWLVLQHLPGAILSTKHQWLNEVGNLHELLHSRQLLALYDAWGKKDFSGALDWAEQQIVNARQLGIDIVTFDNSDYPPLLREIADPPFAFYIMGARVLLKKMATLTPAIAVVGARKTTPYGIQVAEHFSRELVAAGVILVSGMALGVDAIAHQMALKSRIATCDLAPTVGVLGCGVDRIYPYQHRELFRQMSKYGLLISELPLGTLPQPYHFPVRNRLISGLSAGVLVVQASMKSGSLITAKQALEQGRVVYTVPAPIFDTAAAGNNWLLRQGATPVMQAPDIIEEVSSQYVLTMNGSLPSAKKTSRSTDSLNPLEQTLYNLVEEHQVGDVEWLVSNSGLSSAEVLQGVSSLELLGLLKRHADGRFYVDTY